MTYAEAFCKCKLDVNIADHFSIAHKSTKESRLRLLYFKFIHNTYPANVFFAHEITKESRLKTSSPQIYSQYVFN